MSLLTMVCPSVLTVCRMHIWFLLTEHMLAIRFEVHVMTFECEMLLKCVMWSSRYMIE